MDGEKLFLHYYIKRKNIQNRTVFKLTGYGAHGMIRKNSERQAGSHVF